MTMNKRIAVIAGVLTIGTAVSAAITDQPASDRRAQQITSKEVSSAELVALWRQVPASNMGAVSYARPQ